MKSFTEHKYWDDQIRQDERFSRKKTLSIVKRALEFKTQQSASVTKFLTTEMHKNSFGISFVALCLLSYDVQWTYRFSLQLSYSVIFRYKFFGAIKYKMQANFRKFEMLKRVS
jgi:hypothetical protein